MFKDEMEVYHTSPTLGHRKNLLKVNAFIQTRGLLSLTSGNVISVKTSLIFCENAFSFLPPFQHKLFFEMKIIVTQFENTFSAHP